MPDSQDSLSGVPEMRSQKNIQWILKQEVTFQKHLEIICISQKLQIPGLT